MRSLVLVCLAGCGRVGFEARTDAPGDGPSTTSDASIAALSPLAWWKLDDGSGLVAVDSAGSTHGTLVANPTLLPAWTPTSAPRPAGYALTFNGDGDTVSFGAPPSLANIPELTVAGWINATTVADTGTVKCLFDKGLANAAGWAVLVGNGSSGAVTFITFDPLGSNFVTTGPDAVMANRWTHIAATWDGTHTGMRLFVDGVERAPSFTSSTTAARTDDSTVGAAINCIAGYGLTGQIDDVVIFDRILTPAEIALLYGS